MQKTQSAKYATNYQLADHHYQLARSLQSAAAFQGPSLPLNQPEFTLTGPKFTITGPEFTLTRSEFTLTGPEFTLTRPKFTLTGPEFTLTRPEFTLTGSVYSITDILDPKMWKRRESAFNLSPLFVKLFHEWQ